MKWLTRVVIAAVLAGSAGPGQAQVVDKKALTLEGARHVIATAIGEARRLRAPGGVIAVVDDGGSLIALERLDGSFAAGAAISIGKARTAAIFKRPTRTFEDIIKNGRTAGTHLGTIKGPEHPHNLAWGDDDGRALYLAAQTGLYRLRLGVGGQP